VVRSLIATTAIVLIVGSLFAASRRAATLRIALVEFKYTAPSETGLIESALRVSLDRDSRVIRVDDAMVKAALKGFGYEWSTNMTSAEASRLGAAIGCDYFVLGKAELLERSNAARESHEQAYAALFFVDARTGKLELFDFVLEESDSREAAAGALKRSIEDRRASYVDRLIRARSGGLTTSPGSKLEPAESMPDEGSTRAAGFKAPQFANRVKPEYTREADIADVTATVEASVVFKASGEIGEIEITRWAGYGLEESSVRAINQLKFKPAMRDGQPVSVRATVQYNFRRLDERKTKT
jgi:hypothetical protein